MSNELDVLSKKIAEDIKDFKKVKKKGYISSAVKKYSKEISVLLWEKFYSVTDLFKYVSIELGEEPCNHRNFRTLCDRYCYPDSAQQNNPRKKSNEPNPKGKAVEKAERKEAPKENTTKKADDLKLGDDVQSPGDEWDEIFEALGPLKKIELWRAIERGLTLKIAKEAHQNGLRKLQEKLSEFAERKF